MLSHFARIIAPTMFISTSLLLIILQRMKKVSSMSYSSTIMNKIVKTKKIAETIYIGYKEGQYRGENPMNPSKVHIDYYYWLRDETRKNETVLNHLIAENEYFEEQTIPLKELHEKLYQNILSHLQETDEEVPYQHGNYFYYSRTVKGLSYKIHCRKLIRQNISDISLIEEEIVLDENKLAEGQTYSVVSEHIPSPSHHLLAYSLDNIGYETYTIHIKQIASDDLLSDKIEDSDGTIVWGGSSNDQIFYMKVDSEHRPYQLYMHKLGTPQDQDVCLFEETNGLFWMSIEKTASEKFLVVSLSSSETTENHIIDLTTSFDIPKLVCVSKRKFGLRYAVDHYVDAEGNDLLLLVTNKDDSLNNKLVSIQVSNLYQEEYKGYESWVDVKPYDPKIKINEVMPFQEHIVITGRSEGLERVWVTSKHSLKDWKLIVPFNEAVCSLRVGDNYMFDTCKLRLIYSSLVTPKTVFDYDMNSQDTNILKVNNVPNYDASQYISKRILAFSADKTTEIPISLVYHKSLDLSKPNPLFLYGYGSYGMSIDPNFDFKRITLLDNNIIYAIASIRGGGEFGRGWYEDGKYLNKKNTFNDFGDCAKYLIANGFTTTSQLAVCGRSAGGLLIGACINMFPGLFKAAIADVPFVDVVNTMSDPTIPLTIGEWEEWGNPNLDKYYDYMMSYSPYDNIRAQDYPALLINAGLHDPRVAYWEPAKFVAKLREFKTDSNILLLKTDLSSGHFSASDRYKYLKETAFEYAFIIDQICDKS